MSITERTRRAHELLHILNTVPAFVFDLFDYRMFGEYRLHTLLLEKLLQTRRQFDGFKSVGENLEDHYGKHAAQLAESLI